MRYIYISLLVVTLNLVSIQQSQGENTIIHDGEFEFLYQQHGEKWKIEDKEIDLKLQAVRTENGGKRPNIIYILVDDVPFGDFGIPELNYVRGTKTPNINRLATEGLSLMRMYTEPSCTPTRIAFMTGRHPVRTGTEEVKVALVGEGLSEKEVTIAEVLSAAGYNTSHVGKWHMGDIEESYPHNQGFDYAVFPIHQQVQLSLMTRDADWASQLTGWYHGGQSDEFAIDGNFKPTGLVTGVEAQKGGLAREVGIQAGEEWTQEHYNEMNERYQRQVIEQLQELAKEDKPFFLQYWPMVPITFVRSDRQQFMTLNGGTMVESMQQLDMWIGDILKEIETLGIGDNTIVMLMADNGAFRQYSRVTGMSDFVYRGGKADHLEGGVRVNAFIWWPQVIPERSFAGDIVHVSDLFTTFSRIAQASQHIPNDRVIDGVDQSALIFLGEGHGRRDYVYIYEGTTLRSIVKQKFKMHLPAPGVPGAGAPMFDLMRDPREEYPLIGISLWAGASFQDMIRRHLMTIARYPHFDLATDRPYGGIVNLRPESKEALNTFMSWKGQK